MAGLFGFLGGGGSSTLRPEVKAAIQKRHDLSDEALDALRTVEKSGRFASRPVTYFRIFRPTDASAQGFRVRSFEDLATKQGLIAYEGHEEMDTRLVTLKSSDRPTTP